MIELLRNARGVLSEDSRYWSEEIKEKVSTAPYWSAEKWIDILSQGGGQKKRFQYCLNQSVQENSCTFEPFKVILDPALEDNVLLPMDFTKYVYHVGNGKELRSTEQNGLVPGGFSTKTGRHAVSFTVVNPMDD